MSNRVETKLIQFFNKKDSCLFAGAGVGVKSGLPTWHGYLDMLIELAIKYEEATADLMKSRVKDNMLLEAATLFIDCPFIPEGEKYKALSDPFIKNINPRELLPLVALPFSSIVTTNYDRSLYDAYYTLYNNQIASGLSLKSPLPVELGDPSMKQAIYWTEYFIARIHGRAEIPKSIVIDKDGYRRLDEDPSYQDFLLHILKNYHCLFIGFSFIDPAINKIFSIMTNCLPLPYPKLHLALLPNDANKDLIAQLAKFNIETFFYDTSGYHAELWEGVKLAQKTLRGKPRSSTIKTAPIKGIERYLATCYSRLKIGNRAEPLYEVVAEGIVAQAIADAGTGGVTKDNLVNAIKKYFNLPNESVINIIIRAFDGLSEKGICSLVADKYVCNITDTNMYDDSMSVVITGVLNRLLVREGVTLDSSTAAKIPKLIQKILIARGWDLGAHFAGKQDGDLYDSWDQIHALIKEECKGIKDKLLLSIANSIFDTLRHPDDAESEVLCDLGRIAFAVELVMNQSASVIKTSLVPETIYLDSNVLLPAIVEGHPYSPVYADVISRIRSAVTENGKTLRIFVGRQFLNEVVSHRALAIDEVKAHNLNNIDNLRRYIAGRGPENVNVYTGAFSSYVAKNGNISFDEFLRKVAPYKNEDELSLFLKNHNIIAINFSFADSNHIQLYENIKCSLIDAYNDLELIKPKPKILIEHEAAQLATLLIDIKLGMKPIFVSADKKLMAVCKGPTLSSCAGAIVTHLGLIQLVDLLLGVTTDKRSLARLMWNLQIVDKKTYIREFLISQALRHYDDAMAMAMWDVVDGIAELAVDSANKEGIDFWSKSDIGKTSAFLDRFENDFFGKMAAVIEKRKQEAVSSAPPNDDRPLKIASRSKPRTGDGFR
ncbi:MAG: hypothetical protein GJT30_15765 [Geobacter sp.]|nr:hypothetical protein [Geobacter sp.]